MTAPPSTPEQRGWLIPIGGAEAKTDEAVILRRFVEVAGGPDSRLVVIPTASRLRDTGARYVDLFERLGCGEVASLRLRARADGDCDEHVRTLREATGVFLTGGNQSRLTGIIGGTRAHDEIVARNRSHGLAVAGTSAGAAVMSGCMIAFGHSGEVPAPGMVALADGFGLLPDVIVDQHFTQRTRVGRLLTAVARHPDKIGLGIDEDTSVFVDDHQVFEVVGSGSVTVIDPAELRRPAARAWDRNEPLALVGLRQHILVAGMRFDLRTREVLPDDEQELS